MDLNLIKNYTRFTKGHSIDEQIEKVSEEYKEVMQEWDKEVRYDLNMVGELLDLMTAAFNAIYMIQSDEDILNMMYTNHIKKLDDYLKYKYNTQLYIEKKSRRLQLLIKPSIYEKLKRKAAETGGSINDLVNIILEDN